MARSIFVNSFSKRDPALLDFVELLNGESADRLEPWYNLGAWSPGDSYQQAARALAVAVGQAAGINSADHLLDLACGYGASLSLWRELGQVASIAALESNARGRAYIESLRLPHVKVLPQHSFEDFARTPPEHIYDAVLCVDAAYHFSSARDLARTAARVLRSEGRLAFTTLLLHPFWHQTPLWRRWLCRALCRGALMPRASIVDAVSWQRILGEEGFVDITTDDYTQTVCGGFAAYIAQRRKGLTPRQRWSLAWIKIDLTSRWAAFLSRTGQLRYALIVAHRSRPIDG